MWRELLSLFYNDFQLPALRSLCSVHVFHFLMVQGHMVIKRLVGLQTKNQNRN